MWVHRWVMRLPLVAWCMIAAGLLMAIVRISFDATADGFLTNNWSFENWRVVATTERYTNAVVTSIVGSIFVATLALGVALPAGRWLALHVNPIISRFVLPLLAIPYCGSYVLRLFSIQPWLSGESYFGIVQRLFSLHHDILYTAQATFVGQLSVLIPLLCSFCYFAYVRIPSPVLYAAQNLGVRGGRLFWHLELPLAAPLLLSGWVFAFAFTLGDAVAPFVLGGGNPPTAAVAVLDRTQIGDWPSAAAIALELIAGLMLPLFFLLWIWRVRR